MIVRLGFVVALVLVLVGGTGWSTASAAAFPYGGATLSGSGGIGGDLGVHRVPGVGSKVQVSLTGLTPGAWYRWQLRIDDNQCGPFSGGPSPVAGSVLIASPGVFQANAAGQAAGLVLSPAVVPDNHSYVTVRVDEVGAGGGHACGTVENWPVASHTWW
jgi:hypothetical protein